MTPDQFRQHLISAGSSVRSALETLNDISGLSMALFAVDDTGRLLGTVTGGDIRRALLRGVSLEMPVTEAMNSRFTAITSPEETTAKVAEGKRRHLKLLPVIRDGVLIDIINLDNLKAFLPIDVVMMAGGRGERLRPLTLDTPKPLLEVGGMPIIDRNIEILEQYGVGEIFVTVNYLHEKIEAHFAERNALQPAPRAMVRCVLEPKRLGTLGSVAYAEGLRHDDVLVMNSDLLTTIDFAKMWLHHKSSGADITMAAVPYTVSVPYAIMETEGTRVKGLVEKPTYNYFANAGVYMIRKPLLDKIRRGEYMDAPDFILSVIESGGHVEYFPIEGRWIDIGSPDDFRAANKMMGG